MLRFILSFIILLAIAGNLFGSPVSRLIPDPRYPDRITGELKLNYYYDRTGRWVKFSDWIPFQQNKNTLRFAEDFYLANGLPHSYKTLEIKESIYLLVQALTHKFRHPRNALAQIRTEEEFHKYRLLFAMHVNLLLMRMHLRMGSLYDKRHLYFHDLDFADDLEVSFRVAKTRYMDARTYWQIATDYAKKASVYRFTIDLPTMESERFQIMTGDLDFGRIIDLHEARVDAKLEYVEAFLDQEGRPRPVKTAIQKDLEKMADENYRFDPLGPPVLDPEWKETPLYDDHDEFFGTK